MVRSLIIEHWSLKIEAPSSCSLESKGREANLYEKVDQGEIILYQPDEETYKLARIIKRSMKQVENEPNMTPEEAISALRALWMSGL